MCCFVFCQCDTARDNWEEGISAEKMPILDRLFCRYIWSIFWISDRHSSVQLTGDGTNHWQMVFGCIRKSAKQAMKNKPVKKVLPLPVLWFLPSDYSLNFIFFMTDCNLCKSDKLLTPQVLFDHGVL